jgi:hypothetical protein
LLPGVIALCAAAGCGRGAEPTDAANALAIDELNGSVAGVPLGASLAEVQQRLGPGTVDPPPASGRRPALPYAMAPPEGFEPGDRVVRVEYQGLLVYVAPRTGVYAFYVWRAGSRTRGGLRIGDSQARARERYPSLRCTRRRGGVEQRGYRYCTARQRAGNLWIGGDPVVSIALGTTFMA